MVAKASATRMAQNLLIFIMNLLKFKSGSKSDVQPRSFKEKSAAKNGAAAFEFPEFRRGAFQRQQAARTQRDDGREHSKDLKARSDDGQRQRQESAPGAKCGHRPM